LGPPREGEAAIGYAVLPQFQGRGLATEMVGALVGWALDHPEVVCVVAETEKDNPASAHVLGRLGFKAAGAASVPGGTRYSLARPMAEDPMKAATKETEP
jgi:RimJ/RimL family protein N-acetyltransferase